MNRPGDAVYFQRWSIEEAARHFLEELFRHFRQDRPDVIEGEARELLGGRSYE